MVMLASTEPRYYEKFQRLMATESDTKFFKAIHPVRVAHVIQHLGITQTKKDYLHLWSLVLGGDRIANELLTSLADTDPAAWGIPEIIANFGAASADFRSMAAHGAMYESSTNFGAMEGSLLETRFFLTDWRTFQTRDGLERRLEETDIGGEIPCSYFRLPYSRMYLEFGETRSSSLQIWNAASGQHIAEGVYLEEYRREVDGKPLRSIFMFFVGSPVGKSTFLDDATFSLYMHIENENQSLSEAVEQVYRFADSSPNNFDGINNIQRQQGRDLTAHVAKILLYLNSSSARIQQIKEASEIKERLGRVKGGKRAKLERQAAHAYDRILVGPEKFNGESDGYYVDAQGRTVKPHYRRGFFRNQRHGVGLSETKLMWIEPTLVRADLGLSKEGEKKLYVISG